MVIIVRIGREECGCGYEFQVFQNSVGIYVIEYEDFRVMASYTQPLFEGFRQLARLIEKGGSIYTYDKGQTVEKGN